MSEPSLAPSAPAGHTLLAMSRTRRFAGLCALVIAFAEAAHGQPPGAFELVQRVRDAYDARGVAVGLPEPEAAAVEGEEDCGEARCWVLVATLADGRELRLWVEQGTFLLHRADGIDVPSLPPPAPDPKAQDPVLPGIAERIEVALESVVVRVVDPIGTPIVGLGAGEFRLFVGRREIPLEGVEWVGRADPWTDAAAADASAPPGSLADEPRPAGKLVLFFVQADFEPSRLSGHLRMLGRAKKLIRTFAADDLVGVVSFDSRLKLRSDFTRDPERLSDALDAAIRTGPEPRIREQPEPSLRAHWKFREARDAASPERALEVATRALVPLPGEKTIVFLGWGLGNLTPIGVRMPPAYDDALRALDAARATVFVLDVSTADYHSLEFGLEQIAEDTGGTYEKTHIFPDGATRRLARKMDGHYLLYYRRPEGVAAGTDLRVVLVNPRLGEVIAPRALLR